MTTLPLLNTIGVLLCITVASYVQVLTGFAFGLIFLAMVGVFGLIPVEVAANAVTLITLGQTFIHFREYPLTDEWRVIQPAIWPCLVGVAAGLGLLFWLSDGALHLLTLALGLSVMGSAALLVIRWAPKAEVDPPRSFALTGLLSGLMGGMFSTAGPPLVYKLYRQPLSLPEIRQALLVMFGLSQLARLGLVLVSGQFTLPSMVYAVLAMPLIFGVTRYNRLYPPKLSTAAVSRVAAALLFMAGASLMASAL